MKYTIIYRTRHMPYYQGERQDFYGAEVVKGPAWALYRECYGQGEGRAVTALAQRLSALYPKHSFRFEPEAPPACEEQTTKAPSLPSPSTGD